MYQYLLCSIGKLSDILGLKNCTKQGQFILIPVFRLCLAASVWSGSKIFDWGWVNFLLIELGQASHLWFGFGKFPLKIPNFSISLPQVKKNLFWPGQKVTQSKPGWPLIYCGSKVRSTFSTWS